MLSAVGATGSDWQSGSVEIDTFYRAFSADSMQASLGAHIGLNHVNITMNGELAISNRVFPA